MAEPSTNDELERLTQATMEQVKRALFEQIRIETPLLFGPVREYTEEEKARYAKAHRKERRREWVRNHLPVMHLGPCNHDDCDRW
jgi:hypothetical protein